MTLTDLINLTPHHVRILRTTGDLVELPASGFVQRAEQIDTIDPGLSAALGVRVVRRRHQTLTEIWPPGVPCLVSALVAGTVQGRPNVFTPDTGPDSAIRDANGQILAVRGLIVR